MYALVAGTLFDVNDTSDYTQAVLGEREKEGGRRDRRAIGARAKEGGGRAHRARVSGFTPHHNWEQVCLLVTCAGRRSPAVCTCSARARRALKHPRAPPRLLPF